MGVAFNSSESLIAGLKLAIVLLSRNELRKGLSRIDAQLLRVVPSENPGCSIGELMEIQCGSRDQLTQPEGPSKSMRKTARISLETCNV